MRFLIAAALIMSVLVAGCRHDIPDGVYRLPECETLDLKDAPAHLTLVQFTLPDNEVCEFSDSIMELAADKFRGDVKFVSVDVNLHRQMADSLRVAALPAILFVRRDGQRDWHIGPMTYDELEQTIRDADKD